MSEHAEKRHVTIGVSGSIAAYKSPELVRMFTTRGYQVRCIMTDCAREFISPMTLESVSGSPVLSDFWKKSHGSGIDHIDLADWTDALVIAPATADLIAKLAHGFADSPLLAVALAVRAPILIAPAMNVNMYEHVITRENIEKLRVMGMTIIEPEEGALACGWHGTGRLASLHEVFMQTRRALSVSDFAGKRILVSTGPTREPIDPVRYVTNRSSGKMGAALAIEAYRRGADVSVVHGPISPSVIAKFPLAIKRYPVVTAEEMKDAMLELTFNEEDNVPDIVIMAAAVADYRPAERASQKIKKSSKAGTISVTPNPDILKLIGEKRSPGRPHLVGFAIETGELPELLEELNNKLKSKNADLMVGNFAEDAFDLDTNRVWLIDKHGRQDEVATSDKHRVADKILNAILKL
ncbi:MAG: bifunctional phosphopantothenoylcysteine decarboxylase/phosphopantothenate--cysteine ligase CoaBC [Deltaproteobacteria bacterium]|nr:bifunctional phosphopantothenoylcysteine decarboxylase/phosphopantothenate--cysteine ligase CoaBC [Deltaproteobacteria bacterium]